MTCICFSIRGTDLLSAEEGICPQKPIRKEAHLGVWPVISEEALERGIFYLTSFCLVGNIDRIHALNL
jgi:hypothetical protein